MSKIKKSKLSTVVSIFVYLFIITNVIIFLFVEDENQSMYRKYNYDDERAPSIDPPEGLLVSQVPQFISIGFDDNGYSGIEGSRGIGGMSWAINFFSSHNNPTGNGNSATYDGSIIKASFYMCTKYIAQWLSESPTYLKKVWRTAYEDGHEIGLHSHNHPHGGAYDVVQWKNEIQQCIDWLIKPFDSNEPIGNPDNTKGIGILPQKIIGWRTPELEYNNRTFIALKKKQIYYDCSIEEGWQRHQDGTDFLWPYTLDNGSPGNKALMENSSREILSTHTGIWELPVYVVIVPPDDKCKAYGIDPGLRVKLKALHSYFNEHDGKIVGVDYNLWINFDMTKSEVLATLKYTLDLRLQGNRVPFCFGAHTDYYSSKYDNPLNSTYRQRQQAIEEFILYALSKPEIRVVNNKQLLDWLRNPSPL